MADKPPPDYELAERLALTSAAQVKALGHPLRTTILGLLHERAATVTELAAALGRPKSTVAHHVKVLAEAGLVRVVRTRRVRAIEERFYGRTARMFFVAVQRTRDGERCRATSTTSRSPPASLPRPTRTGSSGASSGTPGSRTSRRREFWERMAELVREFDQLPRSGDTMYGFAVGIYPTDQPTLPPRPEPGNQEPEQTG